ncbi:MAG TPA: reverse transcriptase domain-containing protein, partial [Anaerolineales bacterium]|nr:reverse transcriptase domain-containing protein [Anaerolineales bacterium]
VAETNERRNGNHRHLNIPLLQDIPPTPPDEVEEVITLPPPTNPPPGLTHPPAESQTPINNIAQVEANVAAALLTQSTEVIQNVATRQYTSDRQMQRTIETEINNLSLTSFSLKRGMTTFGKRATIALEKEMRQMYEKGVFYPINRNKLTAAQRKKILRTICFLTEKSNGQIKARFCADGRLQAVYGTDIDPASPTVKMDSVMITTAIDAYEKRHVTIIDIEGAYLAVNMTEEVIIEISPPLTEIIKRIVPEYANVPTHKGCMYAWLQKALYGCIQSARLFYEDLKQTLAQADFHPNPYDICIFNRGSGEQQCTTTVHVDDIKFGSRQPELNIYAIACLTKRYKKLTIKQEQEMEYLGMELRFNTQDQSVSIHMERIIEECGKIININKGKATSPATDLLFERRTTAKRLQEKEKQIFHSLTAKLLFLAKRGRPDILTPVSVMTTRTN